MDQDKFDLLKSHIDAFTRKDGSVVAAHDDSRQSAVPKPGHFETSTGKTGEAHHNEMAKKHKFEAINANGKALKDNHHIGEKLHQHAATKPNDSMAVETANNFSKRLSSGELTAAHVEKAKTYHKFRQQ